jgi:hypothetical protein
MLECFENLVGAKSCNDIGYKNYIENLNVSVKKLQVLPMVRKLADRII